MAKPSSMFFKMVCFKLKKIDLNPVSIVSSESVEALHYLNLMEHRELHKLGTYFKVCLPFRL